MMSDDEKDQIPKYFQQALDDVAAEWGIGIGGIYHDYAYEVHRRLTDARGVDCLNSLEDILLIEQDNRMSGMECVDIPAAYALRERANRMEIEAGIKTKARDNVKKYNPSTRLR